MNISIEVTVADNIGINGYENEYSQVLLNIILNCRDAFEVCNMGNQCLILINVFEENNKSVVTISDNAGGIPEDVIDKISILISLPRVQTKGPVSDYTWLKTL